MHFRQEISCLDLKNRLATSDGRKYLLVSTFAVCIISCADISLFLLPAAPMCIAFFHLDECRVSFSLICRPFRATARRLRGALAVMGWFLKIDLLSFRGRTMKDVVGYLLAVEMYMWKCIHHMQSNSWVLGMLMLMAAEFLPLEVVSLSGMDLTVCPGCIR